MGTGSSYAGFVDNRATDGVVEVNYKSIAVEDLVADIVPPEYQTEYANQGQRKIMVNITGKGTWYMLLTDALKASNVSVDIDQASHRVKFADRSVSAVRPLAPTAAPSTAPEINAAAAATAQLKSLPFAVTSIDGKPVPSPAAALRPAVNASPALAPVATPAPSAFTTTSSDYQVSAVLQRWATQANMQYVWEPRSVEFQVSAENDWGTDLDRAVRDLLTSVQANQSARAGRDRVRACIHPNKPKAVLRIIRFEEQCEGDM